MSEEKWGFDAYEALDSVHHSLHALLLEHQAVTTARAALSLAASNHEKAMNGLIYHACVCDNVGGLEEVRVHANRTSTTLGELTAATAALAQALRAFDGELTGLAVNIDEGDEIAKAREGRQQEPRDEDGASV